MEFTSENILLVLSVMIFISIAAGKAGFKYGIPGLLVFLAVGMAMGSDGIGYAYDNYPQAQFMGMVALCVILFSGGMNTRYSDIKPVWKEGVVLATLGVLFTIPLRRAMVVNSDLPYPEGVAAAEAEELKAKLEEAGASVTLK